MNAYKNIKETQKLFSIEGVDRGQVRVRTSDYLLSLPDDKQIEVLTKHLEDLKAEFERYENATFQPSNVDEINETQLKVVIEVTEALLSQIKV
jgi:hypothetical protein